MAHQNPNLGRRRVPVPVIDESTRNDLQDALDAMSDDDAVDAMSDDDDDDDFGKYAYVDTAPTPVAMNDSEKGSEPESEGDSENKSAEEDKSAENINRTGLLTYIRESPPRFSVTQGPLYRTPPETFLHTRDNEPPAPAPGGGPRRPGRSTCGVELEFLLAVALREDAQREPHPGETRWLSPALINLGEQSDEFFYTIRNNIIEIMRRFGIVVNRTEEFSVGNDPKYYLRSLEFDDDPSTAGRPPNANDTALASWVPPVCDSGAGPDIIKSNVKLLTDAFTAEHRRKRVELRYTRPETTHDLAQRQLVPGTHALPAGWTDAQAAMLRSRFIEEMTQLTIQAWEEWQTTQEDPLHVPIFNLATPYKAWTAKTDFSVDAEAITATNYEYPPDWVMGLNPPPKTYKWWGAEVCTPVYDINSRECLHQLQICCGALRQFLRIHKPMEAACCGLHVHFGHEDGWNLQELKRIATVWMMVEDYMYALQRKDREEYFFCAKLVEETKLSCALFGTGIVGRCYESVLPNGGTLLSIAYDNLMRTMIPIDEFGVHPMTGQPEFRLKDIVQNIWRFPSISSLNEALQAGTSTVGMHFRVQGLKRSTKVNNKSTDTLEVRIMQGTLDSEHI